MAEYFEDGFKAAFVGAITGLVISIILVLIKVFGPMYSSSVTLIELGSLVASILLITKLKYWATGYLAGYLLAMWLLSFIGLAETWLFLLYALVGIPVIILRFFGKIADFLDDL